MFDLFNKYDKKFGIVKLQRPSNVAPTGGKSKYAWDLLFDSSPDCPIARPIGPSAGPDFAAGPSKPSLSRLSSGSVLLHTASTPPSVDGFELSSYLDSDTT